MNSVKSLSQEALMKFDPASGEPNPYPSHAAQYREYHGKVAWLFNPWTGSKRDPLDIGSDVIGLLLVPRVNVAHIPKAEITFGIRPCSNGSICATKSTDWSISVGNRS